MNSEITILPSSAADAALLHDEGANAMIITVENGVVSNILPTGPVEVVVVDLDLIENEDTFEQRMRKSVLPMAPESLIASEDVTALITTIVQEYRRIGRTRTAPATVMRGLSGAADTRRCT